MSDDFDWAFVEREADAGEVDAMKLMGMRDGDEGRRHSCAAWWRAAAETGDTFAMVILGGILAEDGDREEAARIWGYAAEDGDPDAVPLLVFIDTPGSTFRVVFRSDGELGARVAVEAPVERRSFWARIFRR